MPEKNPDLYVIIWTWFAQLFSTHNHPICGAIMAFLLSLGRSFLYAKEGEAKRRCVEALMCGLVAFCTRPVLTHFNFEEELITPIGAIIGLFGIDIVRKIGLHFFNKKLESNNDQNNL